LSSVPSNQRHNFSEKAFLSFVLIPNVKVLGE
jgi:hypothetical protein